MVKSLHLAWLTASACRVLQILTLQMLLMKNALAYTLLSVCICAGALAQTPISGTINQYTAVLSINPVNQTLEVADASIFAANDRVLLIQMQGAVINEGNGAGFGNVTDLNGAGTYEFATVCDLDIGSGLVSFQNGISGTYNPQGVANASIQLIKVPQYADAVVTGTLTAPAWNGTTGGVLALEVSGTLTLNATIDLNGRGFRGGAYANSALACSFLTIYPDFFYPASGLRGAKKGEGIATYITGKDGGKGTQAQGGGGGNDHNTGGGGGGNYSAGGTGGTRQTTGFNCAGAHPGVGGRTLAALGYSNLNPYVFAGGGGGAGQGNNNEGTGGGNGGGIIMIKAGTLTGNGQTIRASGQSATDGLSDGGGGGGGGGVIMLAVNTFSGALTLEARGGDGADTDINCEGPGGGGAGGVIWSSTALGGVTRTLTGGAAGVRKKATCTTAGNPAAGTAGTELTGLSFAEGSTPTPCVLPVTLLGFDATPDGETVRLTWATAQERNHARFTIERSASGQTFQDIGQVAGQGDSDLVRTYAWSDVFPLDGKAYYRLRMTDFSGGTTYSDLVEITLNRITRLAIQPFPNPISTGNELNVRLFAAEDGETRLTWYDLTGRRVASISAPVTAGVQTLRLLPPAAAGVYTLVVTQRGETVRETVTVR
ncbi:MAG: T9SS type A sorting domain-containing protein [Bacteroidia bacterium]|nr:T9SS type A sorting domain-containing protein [Bacteroidia bacterium]